MNLLTANLAIECFKLNNSYKISISFKVLELACTAIANPVTRYFLMQISFCNLF